MSMYVLLKKYHFESASPFYYLIIMNNKWLDPEFWTSFVHILWAAIIIIIYELVYKINRKPEFKLNI